MTILEAVDCGASSEHGRPGTQPRQNPPAPPSTPVTLEDHILETSAGLCSVLTLLSLQSDDIPDCMGLHAPFLPLREEIDDNADRLQALVV